MKTCSELFQLAPLCSFNATLLPEELCCVFSQVDRVIKFRCLCHPFVEVVVLIVFSRTFSFFTEVISHYRKGARYVAFVQGPTGRQLKRKKTWLLFCLVKNSFRLHFYSGDTSKLLIFCPAPQSRSSKAKNKVLFQAIAQANFFLVNWIPVSASVIVQRVRTTF